jgi:hypothetical protein
VSARCNPPARRPAGTTRRARAPGSCGSAGRVILGHLDLIVLLRSCLPGDACKAAEPHLRRADDPDGRSALAASSGAVGGNRRALPTISSAVKRLNPEGPNTVMVSGSCQENVVIQGFDRLTLIANSGASINDASGGSAIVVDIADSQRITIQGFTINGTAT